MKAATVVRYMVRGVGLTSRRHVSSSAVRGSGERNFPMSGNDMPRSGGIASMMRLPVQSNTEGNSFFFFFFFFFFLA